MAMGIFKKQKAERSMTFPLLNVKVLKAKIFC